jgi:hypothetical protein
MQRRITSEVTCKCTLLHIHIYIYIYIYTCIYTHIHTCTLYREVNRAQSERIARLEDMLTEQVKRSGELEQMQADNMHQIKVLFHGQDADEEEGANAEKKTEKAKDRGPKQHEADADHHHGDEASQRIARTINMTSLDAKLNLLLSCLYDIPPEQINITTTPLGTITGSNLWTGARAAPNGSAHPTLTSPRTDFFMPLVPAVNASPRSSPPVIASQPSESGTSPSAFDINADAESAHKRPSALHISQPSPRAMTAQPGQAQRAAAKPPATPRNALLALEEKLSARQDAQIQEVKAMVVALQNTLRDRLSTVESAAGGTSAAVARSLGDLGPAISALDKRLSDVNESGKAHYEAIKQRISEGENSSRDATVLQVGDCARVTVPGFEQRVW